jgi:hypothetical protein
MSARTSRERSFRAVFGQDPREDRRRSVPAADHEDRLPARDHGARPDRGE